MSTERAEEADRAESPFEEQARAHAKEERAEQGLGPTVIDPHLIERLAVILRASDSQTDPR